MADVISWPELIVLMGFGPGGAQDDSLAGVLHVRETWQLEDDDEYDGPTGHHSSLGRLAVEEYMQRISRRGSLIRVERPDGTPVMVFGVDTVWMFGDGVPAAHDRRYSDFGWSGSDLLHRLPPSRWEGTDFTRLTGPIEATEFLGRPVWAFELAPPSHKPYPLQLVIDAATGMLLRQTNQDFGSVKEWTSIEFGPRLPDELFSYDGPVRDARAEREDEHEREQAEHMHGSLHAASPTCS